MKKTIWLFFIFLFAFTALKAQNGIESNSIDGDTIGNSQILTDDWE